MSTRGTRRSGRCWRNRGQTRNRNQKKNIRNIRRNQRGNREKKKETQKEIHTGLGVAAGVESPAVTILESRGLKVEGETKGKEEKPPGAEVDLTATILGAGRDLKRNN